MKKILAIIFLAALALKIIARPDENFRVTTAFDADWRFLKADAQGAERVAFDDSAWRKLDLPHDWSIAGPFAETNLTGGAGAFLPDGVGWYRKHFSLPETDSGKIVRIEFDGVMANSDVWINGFHLGHRPNGYVGFTYDLTSQLNFDGDNVSSAVSATQPFLTSHLNFDGDNVIAVRCDTSAQPASRWYAGAGIYRHVRLLCFDVAHFTYEGVFVTTPEATPDEATIQIQALIANEADPIRDVMFQTIILDSDGRAVATTQSSLRLNGGKSLGIQQTIKVKKPRLWDLDHPNLYQAVCRVVENGEILDEKTTSFGIRDAHFEADTGFWLNGKNFKLKGVCLHADGGAFGAAIPLSIWEARLKTLKSLGVNAIRTAHNPPAPEFLDLCDRLGFLVMDEMFDCWTVAKNPYDYHLYFDEWSKIDERDTILRDRNHPSVIMYSVGNEIHDTPQAEKAKKILAGLVAVAHEADPTRPVTQALFRPNVSHDYDDGLADMLDVVGQNYRENEILAAHDQKPTRKIVGTENTHDRNQWTAVRDHAPYAGQFLWTGIDYLGESRRWPVIGHGSGLLDRTGAIRPLGRERQSWWNETPMVCITRRVANTDLMPTDPGYAAEERHTQVLFSDWTPKNLQPHSENAEIYSNCKEVELFMNGQSLGKKEINVDASPRNWTVLFAPGILKAVARDESGKVIAMDELKTAGAPAKIILATETKKLSLDFDNVAIVRAKITDANGIEIPRANDLISFQISGPGEIAAVDNGDNADHEPFQANKRLAFQGECVAFVKATATTGKITLKANAAGLTSGSIAIKTVK